MAGTCSLVATRTARSAAAPTLLSLRPSEPIASEPRESVKPSGRTGALGVDAPRLGAGLSASEFVPARPGGLVLRSQGDDSIESDASSEFAALTRRRSPFGLAGAGPADRPVNFSSVELAPTVVLPLAIDALAPNTHNAAAHEQCTPQRELNERLYMRRV
jgi:hypothetical protein